MLQTELITRKINGLFESPKERKTPAPTLELPSYELPVLLFHTSSPQHYEK